MEYLLKRGNKETIREQFNEYVRSMGKIAVFLVIIILSIFSYLIIQHRTDTAHFLALNTFYTELDSVQLQLYHILETDSKNEANEFEDLFVSMEQELERLEALKLSVSLQRDIHDLKNLFSEYRDCIETVVERVLIEQSVEMEEIDPYYESAQQTYTYINNDFKNIYSRLLEFVANREKQQFIRNIVLLLCCLAVFCVVVYTAGKRANRIAGKIVTPIQKLAEQAHKVEMGNLINISNIETIECEYMEINMLSQLFTKMLNRIRQQMAEIIAVSDLKMQMRKKELDNLKLNNELKNMELQVLQMQINPHFLFNTLSMISRNAYMEKAEKTMFLLDCVSSLLRYTLNSAMRSVTLEKEIEMLGNYVYIQEKRFGKRIRFLFDLDESFHSVKIPSLILQPIVENSVSHGLGLCVSGGKIVIRTRQNAEKGIITISDNGCGIGHEELKQLKEHIYSSEFKNEKIGLGNVYHRLKLFYHGIAEMEIESKLGQGTEIIISIPLLETAGGEEDV